jgi:hypothetical protein
MRQEFRETTMYNTIIEAVALGNTKLNDIFTKTHIEKSKLSVYIKNLISLEILQREFSVTTSVKEQAISHRGLYSVTDNFFSFWYHFVFNNISELEAGDVEGIYQYSVEPELVLYTSRKFEDICRQYIRKLNISGDLPFRFDKMGRYFTGNVEIDIVAISKDKKNILIGECKYKNTPFDRGDYDSLKEKSVNNNEANKYYYLFSKSGFSKELKAMENKAIWLIPIQHLFL